MRVRIAFRNTFRNRRRTLLNIAMIAGGVSGVILFKGFSSRVLYDLREITIKSSTSHLQLAKRAYWEKSEARPKDVLLDDYQKLSERIRQIPGVRYASGRISFFGLLSVGEKSFSARGISLDPAAERDKNESFALWGGRRLDSAHAFEVMVGSGLAKRLRLKAGDPVTVLAYTYDGVVNALDLQVCGVFHTQVSEVDDTTFLIPLAAAQRLLDTDRVEQIVVGLDETEKTPSVKASVQGLLRGNVDSVIAKSWSELDAYYHQCVSFFNTQNTVFEGIILSLCLLGVLNTIGMSVFERTGEIGTIQALGETRETVLGLFLLEGCLLGAFGSLAGVAAGTLLALGLNAVKLPMVMPGASTPLVIHIDLFLSAYGQAVTLAILASTLAAVVPALRASRMNIVESLRRYV